MLFQNISLPTLFENKNENSTTLAKNKAVYTAISVVCGWAAAVTSLCKPRNSKIRDRKLDDTDGPTDGPTDQRLIESRARDYK